MMNSVATRGGRCERHTGPPEGSLAHSFARRIRAVTDVRAEDVASGSRSGAEGAIVFGEWLVPVAWLSAWLGASRAIRRRAARTS